MRIFHHAGALMILVLGMVPCLATHALGQPVVVDGDWAVLRTIDFADPMSAVYNPVDGQIYLGQRGSTSGLFRLDAFGFATQISGGSNTAAVTVDPASGDIYQSEDFDGIIFRTALGATGRETWVSGWHGGDDDPVGMAIAPPTYTGDLLSPGQGLMIDRGYNGPDEIWVWETTMAQDAHVLHQDDGTLVNAVDVAIDDTGVFVVDDNGTSAGIIYEVGAGGALAALSLSEAIAEPQGITIDPWNGDLLVLDSGAGRVVRVDRENGAVSEILTGLTPGLNWAGIDISSDGRRLLVTDHEADVVHELGRCTGGGPGFVDCDLNGIHDACDIAAGNQEDCNFNGIPDACDFDSGASEDCNLDGIPDECPVCPDVELVFVMDTSTSMDGEAAALCSSIAQVVGLLASRGIEVEPRLLGICNTPGGAYSCLDDNVANLLGTVVPGDPPLGLEILGNCPGGNEVCSEDWGLATAVVAGLYPWAAEGESLRLIIPLFDEGAWCGDPTTDLDDGAVLHAQTVAEIAGVVVSPITGSGSSAAVVAHAEQIALATGGVHFRSTDPDADIAQGVVDLVLAACIASNDCNGNGHLDECDIAYGTSQDEDGNGIPDECELAGLGDGVARGPGARRGGASESLQPQHHLLVRHAARRPCPPGGIRPGRPSGDGAAGRGPARRSAAGRLGWPRRRRASPVQRHLPVPSSGLRAVRLRPGDPAEVGGVPERRGGLRLAPLLAPGDSPRPKRGRWTSSPVSLEAKRAASGTDRSDLPDRPLEAAQPPGEDLGQTGRVVVATASGQPDVHHTPVVPAAGGPGRSRAGKAVPIVGPVVEVVAVHMVAADAGHAREHDPHLPEAHPGSVVVG